MGNPKNNAVSRAEACRTKQRQEFSYREERKMQLRVVLSLPERQRKGEDCRALLGPHQENITGYFLDVEVF